MKLHFADHSFPRIHTDNWLQNSYAARVAWHRRQARITLAIGALALALLCKMLCVIFC